MIDHIAIGVTNLKASESFFAKALAPLGFHVVMTAPKAVGLGRRGIPSLWLDEKLAQARPLHLAFIAEDRSQVDAFYLEAITAGARDNGTPGVRAHYHRDYYAAFVISPEGHNVEAVCRHRED